MLFQYGIQHILLEIELWREPDPLLHYNQQYDKRSKCFLWCCNSPRGKGNNRCLFLHEPRLMRNNHYVLKTMPAPILDL